MEYNSILKTANQYILSEVSLNFVSINTLILRSAIFFFLKGEYLIIWIGPLSIIIYTQDWTFKVTKYI